jgi:hypothetical protein
MTLQPDRQADAIWRLVFQRVRGMLHPHHFRHEPGGDDEVRQPLGFHVDVNIDRDTLADGDTLVYAAATDTWSNGAGGGAGTSHGVHLSLALPATVIPPGPCNLSGSARTIKAVLATTDDSTVAGTVSAGGTSISSVPCTRQNGLSITWADGDSITVDLTDAGSDGTYLAIDLDVA